MSKENQCQAFTLKNAQCKNKCVDSFCKIHDPKECERREKVRRLYKEIEERSYRYLKYVERECKKARIRHRRWIERLKKKKHTNVQCKAMTKKELPCKISAKSDYCHVHKHLDTNSVAIEKEPESVVLRDIDEVIPRNIDSLLNELINGYYKVEARTYNGPDIGSHKIERINNVYLEEKELVVNVYSSFVSMMTSCGNYDELDSDDDIRKKVKASINDIYERIDQVILSGDLDSILLHDSDIIAAFSKELEDERSKVEIRSYNGPELIPDVQGKIDRIYINEKKSKIGIYDGNIKMLSHYDNFEELGSISDVRNEVDTALARLKKDTDATVKALSSHKMARRR